MKKMFVNGGLLAVMLIALCFGLVGCDKSYIKPALETQSFSMDNDKDLYETAIKNQLLALQRGECTEMTLHLEQTDDSYVLTTEKRNSL